jgi:hypothetical protein
LFGHKRAQVVGADSDDPDDALMRAVFEERNRRFRAASGWASPIDWKRVEAAIAAAAEMQVVLDYSTASAAGLERLIAEWELMVRVANDLEDDAWVADDLANILDLPALGAYYGELFVRHAGASWTRAKGADGPEPAVTRGGVTVLPLELVRFRVFGPRLGLATCFVSESAAMARAGFDRSWLTSTVVALARGIAEERAFGRLPILADALQDAGCEDTAILAHCRGPGPHVHGSWVVNLVLGQDSREAEPGTAPDPAT